MVLEVNGKNEVVFNWRDFSYVIEENMGAEAKDWFDSLVRGFESKIEYWRSQVDDLSRK